MMSVADRFGAPLTFFVEVLELIEMESAGIVGVPAVKSQLVDAVKRGHDAQLHLHPQWRKARNLGHGGWELDMSAWRIGDIDRESLASMLHSGKSWIHELLAEIPDYRCIAFRAGGWCIQPSQIVIEELEKSGILIDSTVATGIYSATKGEWSDFRKAPDKPFWKVDSDVCVEANSGLWEIPIAAGKISRTRHLGAVCASRAAGEGGLAPGCSGSYQGPAGGLQKKFGKIGKLLQLGMVMLDFSTMPADVLIDVTSMWLDRHGADVPVVAIAHTKNFTSSSEKALGVYLEWAEREGVGFATYKDCLGMMSGLEK